ncbi:DUF1134 domain-containing protein [Paradevosia shaoguanensis]
MFNQLGKGLIASLIMLVGLCAPQFAYAQQGSLSDTYSSDDLVERGGAFFGSVSQGLASLVEKVVGQYGLPNGYILGEEAGGALFAGAKYGQGTLYTRNLGEYPVYWQGPSVGLDFGGDGSKVMMLVYSLPDINSIYARYPGVNGSAYVVGGFGMTVMKRQNVVLVPIRSGVGARLGLNVGYLKFTQEPTWNPF